MSNVEALVIEAFPQGPKTVIRPIDLTPDERKRIAVALCLEIDACEDAKRPFNKMWDEQEHMYQADMEAESAEVVEGYGGYAIPIWKPIRDRITNHVTTSFFSQTPVVQCIDISAEGKNVSALERTLDNLADKCGLELEFKRAVGAACNANLGVIGISAVTDSNGKVTGIQAKYRNPQRVVAYPAESETLALAKTAGYFTSELLYRIRKKQADGVYFDCDLLGMANPTQGMSAGDTNDLATSMAVTGSHMPVSEVVVVTELDLGEYTGDSDGSDYKLYIARIAYDSQDLLDLCEYGSTKLKTGEFTPYESNCMVDVKLQPEEEDGVFGRFSLAYSMRVLQDLFSDIVTTLVSGGALSAFGATFIIGDVLGTTKDLRVKPGDVVTLPTGAQVTYINPQFRGEVLLKMLEVIREVADGLTGLGGLGVAEPTRPGTTATEVDALVTAIQAAKDQYSASCAGSVARCYEILLMLLRHHYNDLKAAYGKAIEIDYDDLVDLDLRLEVSGKTGASSPAMLLKKYGAILELADKKPHLGIDVRAVAMAMLDAMDLPRSTEGLMLSPEDMMVTVMEGLDPMMLQVVKWMHEKGITNGTGQASGLPQGSAGQLPMAAAPQVLGDAQGATAPGNPAAPSNGIPNAGNPLGASPS